MNPLVTKVVNLDLRAGISLLMDVIVQDNVTKLPIDITSSVANLVLLQAGTAVLDLTTPDATEQLVISDPTNGKLSVNIKPATSAEFNGTYSVRLKLTFDNGNNARLIEGTWVYRE